MLCYQKEKGKGCVTSRVAAIAVSAQGAGVGWAWGGLHECSSTAPPHPHTPHHATPKCPFPPLQIKAFYSFVQDWKRREAQAEAEAAAEAAHGGAALGAAAQRQHLWLPPGRSEAEAARRQLLLPQDQRLADVAVQAAQLAVSGRCRGGALWGWGERRSCLEAG